MLHISGSAYSIHAISRGVDLLIPISVDSDIDLLALVEVEGFDQNIDPDKFSIYSYKRIQELWTAGNAFAWHLSLESKLILQRVEKTF